MLFFGENASMKGLKKGKTSFPFSPGQKKKSSPAFNENPVLKIGFSPPNKKANFKPVFTFSRCPSGQRSRLFWKEMSRGPSRNYMTFHSFIHSGPLPGAVARGVERCWGGKGPPKGMAGQKGFKIDKSVFG